MGLVTKFVLVKINGHNLRYYKERGYDCNKGDTVEVSVNDLSDGASNEIEYICDYCGQQYRTKFYNKKDTVKNHEKFCCNNFTCQSQKRKENLLKKWGVDNPMKIKENVEKAQNTCQEKYGVNNPAKVEFFKEKARHTNIDRYGTDNPLKNKDVQQKVKETNLALYGEEYAAKSQIVRQKIEDTLIKRYGVKTAFLTENAQRKLSALGKEASKIQRYICSVYNGELSVEIYPYIADIVMDDNIVCEVDGGGHFLKIKLGQESESLFWKKEYGRENYIISKGYKILRIITHKNNLPSTDILLEIRNLCLNYFRSGYNVFRYNLDDNTFRYY